jgi:hypothetical protein
MDLMSLLKTVPAVIGISRVCSRTLCACERPRLIRSS